VHGPLFKAGEGGTNEKLMPIHTSIGMIGDGFQFAKGFDTETTPFGECFGA
jgi:hypothetical protein